ENWRLPRMAGVDRNVLRLGAFELLFSAETPAGVALNEAIELARRFGSADSPGFVYGVLDQIRRIISPSAGSEPSKRNCKVFRAIISKSKQGLTKTRNV